MKLLARILSHGFAIAVVLLLAIGLIYRGELFPEFNLPGRIDIGKLADHQKESTAGQATGNGREQVTIQSAETGSAGNTGAGVDSAGVVTAAGAPEPAPAEAEVILREPAGSNTSQPLSVIEPEATEAVAESPEDNPPIETAVPLPGGDMPAAAAPLTEESTPAAADELAAPATTPAVIPESPDAAPTLPESGEVIPPSTDAAESHSRSGEKAYQLLASAREAYWLRDYDIAESKYLELVLVEPDNPDGYGELGNMYFSQGQWDQAASAYYEAGVRLVGQGLMDQAEELVAVIRGLSGPHANDLEQKIREARGAAD